MRNKIISYINKNIKVHDERECKGLCALSFVKDAS